MGIYSLWTIIDSVYSHNVPLSQLVHDFQATHGRAPRVAVDGTYWIVATEKAMIKAQSASGSSMYFNPDKPFYERLLNLLLVGIDVVVVFDGPNKLAKVRNKGPGISSGRQMQLLKDFMDVCQWLGVKTTIAYAEGEAECARLQRQGRVDFVVSEDSDCLVYGATRVLRKYKPRAGSNNGALKTLDQIMTVTDLSTANEDLSGMASTGNSKPQLVQGAMAEHGKDGFILLALLTGGDHHLGISKIGPNLAARVCFPPERYATPFLDIFRRSTLPFSLAAIGSSKKPSGAPRTTNFGPAATKVNSTDSNATNHGYFKLTEDDELVLGSIIDNIFRELKHGRDEEDEENKTSVNNLNETETEDNSENDLFSDTASTSPTKKKSQQRKKKVKSLRRRMGLALDGNLFDNFPDHQTLYCYLYNNKSNTQVRRPPPGLTANQLAEKQRLAWWFRRAPAMPELLKYWHESNWNMATYMSKLIFNWYCCGRHHDETTALPALLDSDMIGVRDVLATEAGFDNAATNNGDIDNVQLRMTTTNKKFNGQAFPQKYKVRILCPLQFLRDYMSTAAPQFSLDQFVDKLHMSSVYLENNASGEPEQQKSTLLGPRSAIRNGGTAAGTLRDHKTVAANDARLAQKLRQPCEFEVTRESVDAAPTSFARRLVERMHACSAVKTKKKKQTQSEPKIRRKASNDAGSSATKPSICTESTCHGDMATLLQSVSAAPRSSIAPAAATETIDFSGPTATSATNRVRPGGSNGSGDAILSSICALLESSEEDEPAPPQKRRLTAGTTHTTTTAFVANPPGPETAKKTNSGLASCAKRIKSTDNTTKYYKIDSFFESVGSPTASFSALTRPGADEHEVILIGSSDTDYDDDDAKRNAEFDKSLIKTSSGAHNLTGTTAVLEPSARDSNTNFSVVVTSTTSASKPANFSVISISDSTDDDGNTDAD